MKLKTFLKSAIAGFTAFAMAATMMPTSSLGSVQAASTDGNMILHWDMTIDEDGTLKDLTANNHKGAITGSVAPGNVDGIKVVEMTGSGPGTGYVTIPNGTITEDMTELTINMLVKTSKNNPGNWMWTIGSNRNRYLYFTGCCSTNQGSHMRGGACYDAAEQNKGWEHESVITGPEAIKENEWQNMTVTYKDGGKFIFYQNGNKIEETVLSEGAAGTFTLQQLMTADDEFDGFMGRSFYYDADPDFQGKVADFRIYNKELTQEDVTELYGEIDAQLQKLASGDFGSSDIDLKEEDCLGTNDSKSNVISDLVLPATTTINGDTAKPANITRWESSDTEAITNDGKVTRATTNKTVTMTATVERNNVSAKKELTFTVPRVLTDAEIAQEDVDAVKIPNQNDIRGSIYLPTEGANGSKITWESSDEGIITSKDNGKITAGKVTRSANDAKVTLTATFKYKEITNTKTYECTVKKAYDAPETTDYIFAYFPYAGARHDERIYFGTSEDGLNFTALNNENFVIESKLGTHGLRDPFIIRSHEGDKFYLIATDLTVAGLTQDGVNYPGQGWSENQTQGSQSIMIWESTDLVNWSEQRMRKVARDDAGCTWAPEAYWDDELEQYVVFWASKTGDDGYTKQRLYYATTRDFDHFSEPHVWIDAEKSVIDTTVIKVGEYYYRYTKNEDGGTVHDTPGKHIYCERSKSLTATTWEFVHADSLPANFAMEGPCIFKLNQDDVAHAVNAAGQKGITLTGNDIYGLFADHNGSTIFPGLSDDITTGTFHVLGTSESEKLEDGSPLYTMPGPIASHGTIMPITSEEYNNLKMKWDSAYKADAQECIDMANNVATQIAPAATVASNLTLPTTAGDNVTIKWSSSDENVISSTGTVTRPAYNKEDAKVALTAEITVKSSKAGVRDQKVTKTYDVTVTKQAVPKYTVTFDSKGGSKVSKQTVTLGGKAAAPKKNPTKKNYTFAGWYNGKTKYNFSKAVTKNLTLTAKWTKVTVSTPKAPTLKNNKAKQLAVTVKKISGATGYQVTYSTNKKFTKKTTKTAEGKKNTITLKKLKKGSTYYVKVKAFKKDSTGKKVYSKFSKVKSIKIKK